MGFEFGIVMHLLFVDESGTPPKPRKTYPRYFVMAGLIVPEASWPGVRDDLLGMKLRRKLRGEIKWRYFAPDNDDTKNPMRRLSQDERNEIRREMFGIITRPRHKLVAMGAVCSAKAAYQIQRVVSQEDIYHLTYKVLSERFQHYLQDCGTRSHPQRGIIICDHRGSRDDKLLRAHHQMLIHAAGGYTSSYGNLVESLFLQLSHQSIGIQLADLAAGAVWRKFERNDDTFYSLLVGTSDASQPPLLRVVRTLRIVHT